MKSVKQADIISHKPLFTERETQNILKVSFREAKYINQILSGIVRAMWKGTPIFWDSVKDQYSIRRYVRGKKRMVPVKPEYVKYIQAYYGLEWHDVKQLEVGVLSC
jgi:hypothetical protein